MTARDEVVTTTMFSDAEQAAWRIAVIRGVAITAADLRYMLEAAMPHIAEAAAAAERGRLAAVISPAQFRKLADWFDTDDEFKEAMFPETRSPGSRKDEVQQDLRRFALLLDSKP